MTRLESGSTLTTAALGRLVKRKYPQYDEWADVAVGEAVRRKYPAYRDFRSLDFKEQALLESYDPTIGVFRSWWRRRKSEAHNKLLSQLNPELRSVLEQGVMLEDAAIGSERKRAEFEAYLLSTQLQIDELAVRLRLTEEAVQRGETLETSQTKKLASHESTLRTVERQQQSDLLIAQKVVDSERRIEEHQTKTTEQIRLEQALTDIRLREFKERQAIELNQELERMREKVRLALIAKALTGHQRVMLVQELLDGLYKQIDEIEDSELYESTKTRMIEDREEIISHFKGYRNAEGHRLLQDDNG